MVRRALVVGVASAVAVAACANGDRKDARAPGLPDADPAVFEYDRALPLDAAETGAADDGTLHVTFAGYDGAPVPARFAVPPGGDPPFACLLVQHGLGGSKDDVGLADPLTAAGFATLAVDARLHGERGSEAAQLEPNTDPVALERMLRETVLDLRRAVDYLETRPECDSDRLGYVGGSMGAFLGAMLAGADERVQAPVLLVAGADWRVQLDRSDALLPGIEADRAAFEAALGVLDPIDPVRWVPRVSPRPVLMINGNRDEAVPPASARRLHAAARDPKRVVWYEGGHDFPAGAEGDRVAAVLLTWLHDNLG